MKKYWLSLILVFFVSAPQSYAETKKEAYADLAIKVGADVAKTYLSREQRGQIPRSNLPVDRQSKFIEQALEKYTQQRDAYVSAASASTKFGQAAEATFGLAALRVGSPQLKVGLLLAGALTRTIADVGTQRIEATGEAKGRQYLAANRDVILSSVGAGSFDAFQGKSVDEIRNILINATDNFKDIRQRAGDDAALIDSTRDLLTETLLNSQPAILDHLQANSERIAEFADFASDLKEQGEATEVELKSQGEQISAITGKVDELSLTMAGVTDALKKQGRDQAIIADFVFDSMDPAKKAAALKNGFMQERFECPTTVACDGAVLKTKLISQFEQEAKVQKLVSDAGKFVGTLNDINAIAGNLGIDMPPELSTAAEVGNAVMGGLTQYMSGNPVGAIAAVSSIFGQKSDPNAAIMGFLRKMDAKLDQIIEGQRSLIKAMDRLSEQMKQGFEQIDNRLARVEFEQLRMSQGIKELLWRDWKSCYTVVDEARSRRNNGEYVFIDPATQSYKDFDSALTVLQSTGDSFRSCLKTVSDDMSSMSAVRYFGNFIDARWAMNDGLLVEMGADVSIGEKADWRSFLQRYELYLFRPAFDAIDVYRSKTQLSWASEFAILASPSGRVADLNAQLKDFKASPFACYADSERDARLYTLLCTDPEIQAHDLLNRPIIAELTNDIADWIVLLAPLADLYDQQDQKFYASLDELASSGHSVGAGKRMIQRSLRVLDVAVASYNQMYGGLTAKAIADAIESLAGVADVDKASATTRAEAALALMRSNAYVAENAATILLLSHASTVDQNGAKTFPSEAVYRLAVDYTLKGGPNPTFLLEGLFPGLSFKMGKDGTVLLHITAGSSEADLTLPPPNQFSEGRFVFPPRFYALLNSRQMLFDRQFNYNVVNEVPADTRDDFALSLLR
jgi:hypothetical protein